MNKIAILGVIGVAALVFGMITPDYGLMANATGGNNNHNNNQGSNYSHHDDHDDEDDDDHEHDDDHNSGGMVNDPPTIKVYKVVINNQGNPTPTITSFGVKLNGTLVNTNGTSFTITKNKPVTLTESGLTGYRFVEIRGDGHCPENLGGTITLDNGQHIECYIVNEPTIPSGPIQPGVIFRYNTLEFDRTDPSIGDSCSAPGKTDPCIELANVNSGRRILVVDDALKTDTTIVIYSVMEKGKIDQNPPQFSVSPLCTLSGMGPHTAGYAQDPDNSPVTNPTGKLGFEFQCSLLEGKSFKVSYALIETKR